MQTAKLKNIPEAPRYNEKELLELVTQSNETAFTILFNNYKDKIYSIALELTHSDTTAEEIVQDVFLIIWNKRSTLPGITHFTAYLFTVARNEVYRAMKRTIRYEKQDSAIQSQPDFFSGEPEEKMTETAYRKLLDAAITRLAPQQQQVYRLIKEKNMKREEVAAIMKIAPETVKSYLAQAIRNIRAFCKASMKDFFWLLFGLCHFSLLMTQHFHFTGTD